MAVLCTVCLAPLLSLRNLSLLAPMSSLAIVVAGAFVSAVVGLAGIAIFQGQLGDFHWLPTADMLGHTPMRIAINLLAVLPVITMSFVCHYNLLPVVRYLSSARTSCRLVFCIAPTMLFLWSFAALETKRKNAPTMPFAIFIHYCLLNIFVTNPKYSAGNKP